MRVAVGLKDTSKQEVDCVVDYVFLGDLVVVIVILKDPELRRYESMVDLNERQFVPKALRARARSVTPSSPVP